MKTKKLLQGQGLNDRPTGKGPAQDSAQRQGHQHGPSHKDRIPEAARGTAGLWCGKGTDDCGEREGENICCLAILLYNI